MHSPWGALYPIIEKTGWKLNYVLWKVSYANIQLILSDQPNFKKIKPSTPKPKTLSGQGLVGNLDIS